MTKQLIYHLEERGLPISIGNKADGLKALCAKGFRVPTSLVCTWDAYQQYNQGKDRCT